MGLFSNPIDTIKNVAEFTVDTGGTVLDTTKNVTEEVVETTVDVGGDVIDTTQDAAVGAWQFQADVRRFALDKTLDGARTVGTTTVELTNQGVDLAGRGIDALQNGFDRFTHPGDPNPPAAQGLEFAETKGASSLAYDAELGDKYEFPDGKQWEVVDVLENEGTFENGFRGIALRNGDEVIVAFAGTDPLSLGDIGTDILQAAGFAPPQYQMAADFAEKWANQVGSDNVTLTGHSLGGGLASYAAIENDLHATTVNAAPLALSNIGGSIFDSDVRNNPNITNYYVPNEVLTALDIANGLDFRPGNKIAVQGASSTINPLSPIKNHMLGNVAPGIEMPTLVE